jgi:hypothetical protein
MDNNYINSHLIKWAELLYGKDSDCFSKSRKTYFIFGSKKKKLRNKVTKQVALLLVLNKLENDKNKIVHNQRNKKA